MTAPIHPAFRWVRTFGYRADPAVEERLPDGSVRVEQWIWTPEVGWSREVVIIDPQVLIRWQLDASCRSLDAWARSAPEAEILARLEGE